MPVSGEEISPGSTAVRAGRPTKNLRNVCNRTDFQAYIRHATYGGHCRDESRWEGRDDEVPDYFMFVIWPSRLL